MAARGPAPLLGLLESLPAGLDQVFQVWDDPQFDLSHAVGPSLGFVQLGHIQQRALVPRPKRTHSATFNSGRCRRNTIAARRSLSQLASCGQLRTNTSCVTTIDILSLDLLRLDLLGLGLPGLAPPGDPYEPHFFSVFRTYKMLS